MQRPYIASIAAQDTAAASLIHEDLLHLAPATTYRLPAASLAAIVAPSLEPKVGQAMVTAHSLDPYLPGRLG